MKNRANAAADNVKHHFLRIMAIPVLDHVISKREARLSSLSVTSCTFLSLIPSALCVQEADIADAVELYSDALSSPETMDQEMRRWKMKCEGKTESTKVLCTGNYGV